MKIFKDINKNTGIIIILSIIIVFLGCANINTCRNSNQKTEFLTDSITKIKTKEGIKYITKNVPVIKNNKELKEYADSLYIENKRLRKIKLNPIVITKTNTVTKLKNVPAITTVDKYPGYYMISWKYGKTYDNNNFISLNGETKADSLMKNVTTKISNLTVASDLILDVTDNDKNTIKILARSNNPLISITNIEGSIINPKKSKTISSYFKPKRWSIGFNLGEGIGYSNQTGNFTLSPYIGIGLSYNLISF